MNSKIEKWSRWLEIIKKQLNAAMWSRHIYTETMTIITSNPKLPKKGAFYAALQMWYADSVLMALRRQLKSSPQSVSLTRLLAEIRDEPQHLSRSYWLELHAGSVVLPWADRSYDSLVGKGAKHPTRAQLEKEIAKLQKTAVRCEGFIDKRIAHYDRGSTPKSPTWNDVYGALDVVDELFRKYYLLVTASNVLSTTPEIGYDWKKVFRQAWISKPPA